MATFASGDDEKYGQVPFSRTINSPVTEGIRGCC